MTDQQAPTPARQNHLTAWAFLTAPIWLLVAWVVMWPLDGRSGPGVGWTLAHLAWIVGFGALVLVCLELGRRTRRQPPGTQRVAGLFTALTLLGLAASSVQMIVDLVAGFQTSDYDALQARSDELTSYPGMDFVLYTLGPPLVFLGLFAMFALLAVRGLTSPVNAVLVLLALVVIGGAEDLTPVGLAFFAMALAPIGWRLTRADPGVL